MLLNFYGIFQVEIWDKLNVINSVWFFDATGSVHKDIRMQKKPFLYSLVMHDEKNKCILPLAEFISTAHDQVSISRYLTSIKSKLDINRIKVAKSVVVDMSWALINATLLSLNYCNLPNYINWCYYILFKPDKISLSNAINTRVFLCSTHFLKIIIKRAKKIQCESAIRKTFIFMFSLVQNASTIKEIDFYILNIHNIFNSKYLDSTVAYSLKSLCDTIKKRNLNSLDTDDIRQNKDRQDNQEFSQFIKDTNVFISVDFEYEVKKCSPFKTYFETQILRFKQLINKKEDGISKESIILNEYFCPKLFEILSDYLYLVPLWSGLMIDSNSISYLTKTRFTNNPVENWFKQVKTHI